MQKVKAITTRKHSNRMRTVRCSDRQRVCFPGGVLQGCVLLGECVLPGGVLLGGVLPGGVLLPGGVYSSMH